jgi:hypothetical protein
VRNGSGANAVASARPSPARVSAQIRLSAVVVRGHDAEAVDDTAQPGPRRQEITASTLMPSRRLTPSLGSPVMRPHCVR